VAADGSVGQSGQPEHGTLLVALEGTADFSNPRPARCRKPAIVTCDNDASLCAPLNRRPHGMLYQGTGSPVFSVFLLPLSLQSPFVPPPAPQSPHLYLSRSVPPFPPPNTILFVSLCPSPSPSQQCHPLNPTPPPSAPLKNFLFVPLPYSLVY
jgi:hypothetical protein